MNASDRIGVVFDMDGVLVDSAEPHFRSWQILAEENGVTVTRKQFSATFGRQNDDIIPLLFGRVTGARLKQLADRKEEVYRELIRDHPPIVSGAPELIHALHDDGVSLAVGSSGPLANVELILQAMGVREAIPVVVSGDEVTRGKPDPQVFTLACDRLHVTPARCVVIEDAPAGVQAALAAGARVVAVLIYHRAGSFEEADLIVDCLADLSVQQLVALVRRSLQGG